jgi:hypothetical protein
MSVEEAYQHGLLGPRHPMPAKQDAHTLIYLRWYWCDGQLEAYNLYYLYYDFDQDADAWSHWRSCC